MENEERAHFEAHYQNELEDDKNNMAQMASLLEQLLRVPSREGTSNHQPTMLLSPTTLVIFNSQNFRKNPRTRPQGTGSILMTHPITPTQVSTIVDLTT
jgi:hypothetical protein